MDNASNGDTLQGGMENDTLDFTRALPANFSVDPALALTSDVGTPYLDTIFDEDLRSRAALAMIGLKLASLRARQY